MFSRIRFIEKWRKTPPSHHSGSILSESVFFHNFQSLDLIGGKYCINIRRHSVTIREILHKQKNQVRYISHIIIGKKKIRKIGKIEKLRETKAILIYQVGSREREKLEHGKETSLPNDNL